MYVKTILTILFFLPTLVSGQVCSVDSFITQVQSFITTRVDTRFTAAEDRLTTCESSHSSHFTQINLMGIRLDNLENFRLDHSNRISSLEARPIVDVSSINNDISTLQTRVAALEAIPSFDNGPNQTALAQLNTDLSALDVRVQSLEMGGSPTTFDPSPLINQINDLESRLEIIESFMPFPSGGGSGTSEATTKSITQTAHGFAVGNWVYLSGASTYALTDSDAAASADSVGVVTTVTDANTFILTSEGYASGLTGLTAGTRYYLSATAGAITSTAPTSNIKAVFISDTTTSGWVQQYAVVGTSTTLTYGRVRANANLASISYSITSPGTAINFDSTLYSSGMTFSGTNGITPSIAGRYRASWLAMAGSGDFNDDGTFHIVQNGVSLGSVFTDIMQAAGVNQLAPFIDVDLAAGQAVTLNYQPATADSVPWGRGSYFQLTQLPTAVAPVVNTVAEYGEQVLGSSITVPTTSTSPTVATDILSFTLPSAGTWDVDFLVRGATFGVTTSGANGMAAVLTDNSNNVIANTELKVGRESFASADAITLELQLSATGKAQIVTTGATTYKVRGYHDGSGGSTGSWTAQSDNNGRTKVSWNKIAGQLPSTGTTVDYVNVYLNAGATVASNATIPFNTVLSGNIPYNTTTGEFTLTAGKTYSLRSNVNTFNTASALLFSWYNQTTNAIISPTGFISSADHNASWGSNQAEVIFTPTVATVVTLRNTGGISRVIPGAPFGGTTPASQASIVQLGSSAYTTLNTFTGSNGIVAGTTGGVPAPAIADNTKFLKGDGTWGDAGSFATRVIATNSTTQTITSTAATVAFDTETLDANNNFASNTFTAPATGVYSIYCFMTISNISNGRPQILVRKNASTNMLFWNTDTAGIRATGDTFVHNFGGLFSLTAGDTIDYRMSGNAASSGTIQSTTQMQLTIFRIF